MTELIVDMSSDREKRLIVDKVRTLQGVWRIAFTRHRPRRTDRQNRYYWPCFVQPFAEFLREQGEEMTDDGAHMLMRAKFLHQTVKDRRTGKMIGATIRSTTELTTVEFNDYLDRCAHWLLDMFRIEVPDPDIYHEREAHARRATVPA